MRWAFTPQGPLEYKIITHQVYYLILQGQVHTEAWKPDFDRFKQTMICMEETTLESSFKMLSPFFHYPTRRN